MKTQSNNPGKSSEIIAVENFSDKELIKAISDIKLRDFLKIFVAHLKHEHKLEPEQIASLFGKRIPKNHLIPISIFNNDELSCLETIVKYLKEKLKLRFHDIALLLNRDDRTIWATYSIACRKRKKSLPVKESEVYIPTIIFQDRRLSVLESIVAYLKDSFDLRYSQISILLNRDERNIWTVYDKFRKKIK